MWYLIDDLGALHQLLAGGVTTWGELENLAESGGVNVLADFPNVGARARALARAVDAMHQGAAIGRGRPVDRVVLTDSGAVSERRMAEVLALAHLYGESANGLVEALERKELSGFRAKQTAELREYLERGGFLDARPTQSAVEIRGAMVGAVEDDIRMGVLETIDVDRLLERVRVRVADP